MKVLIVDDEKHVRQAIKLLVPWKEYEISLIFESQNVEAAKQLILDEKPEIIFLDMMLANETGIELLSWINENKFPPKVIVVSGYNDFHFVRNTMRFNGVDYLLKPIDQSEIIAALDKAILEWRQDEEKRLGNQSVNRGISQIEPLYLDKALTDYIKEPMKHSGILKEINNGIDVNNGQVQIVLLSLQLIHWKVHNKFSTNKDLLFSLIKNICNESLSLYNCGYAFRDWNYENEIVILFCNHFENTKLILEEINKQIHQSLGSYFFFSAGAIRPLPFGAPLSYEDAKKVIRSKLNLKKPAGFVIDDTHPGVSESETIYINHFEKNLLFAMKYRENSIITSLIDNFTVELQDIPAITLQHIEIWHNEINLLKLKYLKESQGNYQQDLLQTSFILMNDSGELLIDDWFNKLKSSMLLLHQVISKSRLDKANAIYEIASYIKEHYHQDLSLQYFSDHFSLSREHISRKFKQEFGTNLLDFLIDVRMEKAKALLSDPRLRVSDVSKMVGYQDEKYFYKVFKKSIGHSPAQFRKQAL